MSATIISLTDYRVQKAKKQMTSVPTPVTIKRNEIDMFRQLLADVKEGKVWFADNKETK